jgi:ATP-dependent Lon protease
MNISETNIPDVSLENIDESKVVLAESIIKNVYPLFDEVFNTRVSELEEFQVILKNKRNQVREEKDNLQVMVTDYNRKKKITKLLDRVDKMVTSGLVYEGSLKNETTILLKIITKLSDDKLDYHLKSTLRTISKRFSR